MALHGKNTDYLQHRENGFPQSLKESAIIIIIIIIIQWL
jgi:hypothetical protein